MSVTASPGRRSIVSMTTKITPSSTGTARRRRRVTNVSNQQAWGAPTWPPIPPAFGAPRGTRGAPLLVEPGLPERQVVLDRVDGEALHAGAADDDLLGRVDRNPHHLFGEDVLHLAVEFLALGLVEAPARLLDERVDAGVAVPRRVPARRWHLLAVKERVERVVRVGVGGHPAEREHVVVERVGAHLLKHGGPIEHLHLGL